VQEKITLPYRAMYIVPCNLSPL